MNIYEHNKLEVTLDQRSFKHNKSLEIVEHSMMRDTIYYLIIVIYYFWYFYVKNVILGLGDLFPCF